LRSKEVADFAGVTVRTLRHYHQLGILRLNEFIEHAGGMGEYVSLSNEMMALPAVASKEVREDLSDAHGAAVDKRWPAHAVCG
jgi:hypothetical protein